MKLYHSNVNQVKDSFRHRALKSQKSFRGRTLAIWDASQGWVAASLIGIFTAIVAFLVDIIEATLADYKVGYCSSDILRNRESCCTRKTPSLGAMEDVGEDCKDWVMWSDNYWTSFGIYVAFAALFGIIAGAVTMTTQANLPAVKDDQHEDHAGGDEVC